MNLGLASVVFLSLVIKAADLNVAECSAGDYVGPSQSADVTRWVREGLSDHLRYKHIVYMIDR